MITSASYSSDTERIIELDIIQKCVLEQKMCISDKVLLVDFTDTDLSCPLRLSECQRLTVACVGDGEGRNRFTR